MDIIDTLIFSSIFHIISLLIFLKELYFFGMYFDIILMGKLCKYEFFWKTYLLWQGKKGIKILSIN